MIHSRVLLVINIIPAGFQFPKSGFCPIFRPLWNSRVTESALLPSQGGELPHLPRPQTVALPWADTSCFRASPPTLRVSFPIWVCSSLLASLCPPFFLNLTEEQVNVEQVFMALGGHLGNG